MKKYITNLNKLNFKEELYNPTKESKIFKENIIYFLQDDEMEEIYK